MFYVKRHSHAHRTRGRVLIGALVVASLILAACGGNDGDPDLTSDKDVAGPQLPVVVGFYEGQEILFVHPEASDPELVSTLQDMMGSSPVILVEGLADVPPSALAAVHVFTNGIVPQDGDASGPLGFQPDVFDSAPGDAGYSPLRSVVTVTWSDPANAVILTDTASIEAAEEDGRVVLEQSDIVVNMPFIRWPGGQR